MAVMESVGGSAQYTLIGVDPTSVKDDAYPKVLSVELSYDPIIGFNGVRGIENCCLSVETTAGMCPVIGVSKDFDFCVTHMLDLLMGDYFVVMPPTFDSVFESVVAGGNVAMVKPLLPHGVAEENVAAEMFSLVLRVLEKLLSGDSDFRADMAGVVGNTTGVK